MELRDGSERQILSTSDAQSTTDDDDDVAAAGEASADGGALQEVAGERVLPQQQQESQWEAFGKSDQASADKSESTH